ARGYVCDVDERRGQVDDSDGVVVADGSGGTHAGLVAGFGSFAKVLGINVGSRPDIDEQVETMARQAAAAAGRVAPVGSPAIDHGQLGPGYGQVTDECREALDLAARLEGMVLDPVYTGKAMAGLIAARRDGRIESDHVTVFLHTGGTPALFAASYASWIAAGSHATAERAG